MDRNQIVIITMLAISVLILLIPAVVFLVHRLIKPSGASYRKTRVSHMLVFSACLIFSVWCLRYAVGYYGILFPKEQTTLTWWEEIFNSMIHALQTFSMDEDYTDYIIDGKNMFRDMFQGDTSLWQTLYGLYASILNFLSPIAGGAILFEILASVFPKIKLHLSHLSVWKEKYYFSELNSASLALAKSISNIKFNYFKKPTIIFTDTYFDDEEERGSELFLEAKLFGAICIKDDLSHIKKNKWGLRKFFLIDEKETGNLQTLAELANSSNSAYLKKSEIYLFTNDDAYVQLEQRVREKLEKQFTARDAWVRFNLVLKKFKSLFTVNDVSEQNEGKEQEETKEQKKAKEFKNLKYQLTIKKMPTIIPVKSYRNLISNLLKDVPLYEPLVGKKRNADGTQDLTVTILGTGDIGTEMFLSTYWFGQILDCNLKINILSQETEDEFWSKIDYVNPEIKHTTIKNDPILKINRKGDMAEPYCEVHYRQCDVKSSEFIKCLTEPEKQILKTDYFFISLGTDEDNISVANTVRKYVGEHHINLNSSIKTIITYVVYDSELSNMLNRKKYFKYVNDEVDIYMQAIGSLESVYSANNVFMTDSEPFAQKVADSYDIIQNRKIRAEKHRARMNDDYKYWANLSRGMHTKYKVYSMGMIDISLFDYPDSGDAYFEELEKIYKRYQEKISGKEKFEDLSLLHKMAWLEHRRWNAFTRIKGFRHTDKYDTYAVAGKNGSYKQMDIKLHPCLVECGKDGIKAAMTPEGKIEKKTIFMCKDYTNFDLLDELAYDLYEKKYNGYDFKAYDYPIS